MTPHQQPKKIMQRWSVAEDTQLRAAVQKYGTHDWKLVAAHGPAGRTNTQCLQRWSRSLKPGLRKGKWTAQEDALLSELAQAIHPTGVVNWPELARKIIGRTSKQCRERWFEHLSPDVNHGPFSQEEDALVMQLHEQYGNVWSKIVSHMEGRTADQAKIRIRTILRQSRVSREYADAEAQQHQQPQGSPTLKRNALDSWHGLAEWVEKGAHQNEQKRPSKHQKVINVDSIMSAVGGIQEMDALFVQDLEMLLNEVEHMEESELNLDSPSEGYRQAKQQELVKGWAYFVVGSNYFFNNQCDLAEAVCLKALSIAQTPTVSDVRLEGWAYFKLSLIYTRKANYSAALKYGKHAQDVAEQQGGLGMRKWAQIAYGFALSGSGQYKAALGKASAALTLNSTISKSEDDNALSKPDGKVAVWAHQILAGGYNGEGQYKLALAHAEHSLEMATATAAMQTTPVIQARAKGWSYYQMMHSRLGLASEATDVMRLEHLKEAGKAKMLAMKAADDSGERVLQAVVSRLGSSSWSPDSTPRDLTKSLNIDEEATQTELTTRIEVSDPLSSGNKFIVKSSVDGQTVEVDTNGDGIKDSSMTVTAAIEREAKVLVRSEQQHRSLQSAVFDETKYSTNMSKVEKLSSMIAQMDFLSDETPQQSSHIKMPSNMPVVMAPDVAAEEGRLSLCGLVGDEFGEIDELLSTLSALGDGLVV